MEKKVFLSFLGLIFQLSGKIGIYNNRKFKKNESVVQLEPKSIVSAEFAIEKLREKLGPVEGEEKWKETFDCKDVLTIWLALESELVHFLPQKFFNRV